MHPYVPIQCFFLNFFKNDDLLTRYLFLKDCSGKYACIIPFLIWFPFIPVTRLGAVTHNPRCCMKRRKGKTEERIVGGLLSTGFFVLLYNLAIALAYVFFSPPAYFLFPRSPNEHKFPDNLRKGIVYRFHLQLMAVSCFVVLAFVLSHTLFFAVLWHQTQDLKKLTKRMTKEMNRVRQVQYPNQWDNTFIKLYDKVHEKCEKYSHISTNTLTLWVAMCALASIIVAVTVPRYERSMLDGNSKPLQIFSLNVSYFFLVVSLCYLLQCMLPLQMVLGVSRQVDSFCEGILRVVEHENNLQGREKFFSWYVCCLL